MSGSDLLSHTGFSIITFVVTNADDLLLLAAWFATFRASGKQIVAGQYLGITFLIALSLSGIVLGDFLAPRFVSYLGLIPIFLGIKNIIGLLRGAEDNDDSLKQKSIHPLAVAMVTIANGGDNIGVYTPLFARLDTPVVWLYSVNFLVLTGLWCYLGYRITGHQRVQRIFQKYQHIALPVFLIGLGLWILLG